MLPPTKRTGPALVRAVPVALIALAALAVVAASLVPVPDLALAASKPGLSVAPSHTTPGHRVTFTGRLAPHRKRPIVLQRRAGGHWRTVESTHTKHSGRFKVRTRAPATTTIYRVHAKKVRRHGKVVKKVSTGTRRVQVATTHTPTDSPTTAPPVDTTAPPVPTGVTAVPTAAGAASISWEPVVAGDLEGYQVYQAVGSPP